MLWETFLHLPEAELNFLKNGVWVWFFELKRSIFEALHFRVLSDRNFKGINNKSKPLRTGVEKISDVDWDENRHKFLKLIRAYISFGCLRLYFIRYNQ